MEIESPMSRTRGSFGSSSTGARTGSGFLSFVWAGATLPASRTRSVGRIFMAAFSLRDGNGTGRTMFIRIVSGGQTGVDRAALDVALEHGIDCGGWCPQGRKAEDGPIPDRYPLRETPWDG